jgi:hypothetical protein
MAHQATAGQRLGPAITPLLRHRFGKISDSITIKPDNGRAGWIGRRLIYFEGGDQDRESKRPDA